MNTRNTKTIVAGLLALLIALPLSVGADNSRHSGTYRSGYQDNWSRSYSSNSRGELEDLLRRLTSLRSELTTNSKGCYTVGNTEYCTLAPYTASTNSYNLRHIDVEYRNSAAYATVRYTDGRVRTYILGGHNTNTEVVNTLADILGVPTGTIANVISYARAYSYSSHSYDDYTYRNNRSDDVDRIIATIDESDDETRVRVEYDNGTSDRFTYATENRNTVISRVARDIDESERTVRNLIEFDRNNSSSFDDHDIDSIDVTIDRNDDESRARVRFDNGTVRTYYYATESKSRIVQNLSDDLDIDEDAIKDIIDYDYE
jgi:hypothetical protein